MPDREFIHSSSDVSSTFLYALDNGFEVMSADPQREPVPHMLSRDEAANASEGQLYVFRPEWVFGQLQLMAIPGGYNKGKYFVKPCTNFAPVFLYFFGERIERGRRKFGGGLVSYNREWLALPATAVNPTPPEVKVWFKRFVDHLSSGVVVKAGVHKYHVTKGVLADPAAAQCLPPFDFIPWGEGNTNASPPAGPKHTSPG